MIHLSAWAARNRWATHLAPLSSLQADSEMLAATLVSNSVDHQAHMLCHLVSVLQAHTHRWEDNTLQMVVCTNLVLTAVQRQLSLPQDLLLRLLEVLALVMVLSTAPLTHFTSSVLTWATFPLTTPVVMLDQEPLSHQTTKHLGSSSHSS
jgi:hypothetical protein